MNVYVYTYFMCLDYKNVDSCHRVCLNLARNESFSENVLMYVNCAFRYMYWSEWGTENSIKKAAMDGRDSKQLVSTVHPVSSLTLDAKQKRLYWIERNPEKPRIVSSDLDGHDLVQIVNENIHDPVGLTLYKDFIIWSDNKTGLYQHLI